MTVREAWQLVNVKRAEHQDPAGFQHTAETTRGDHARAGMEWITAVAREHRLDVDDALAAMVDAMAQTIPNLRALVLVGALPASQLDQAAFGAGFFSGLATGLELARQGAT